MKPVRTIEEVRALYPLAKEIVEEEGRFRVLLEQEFRIGARVFRRDFVVFVLKPLSKGEIAKRLSSSSFPKKLVDLVLKGPLRETDVLLKVRAVFQKGHKFLILDGPPGIGKSTSAVWYMAGLLHKREIANPSYISFIDLPDIKKIFYEYPLYDAYLLDDIVSKFLSEQKGNLLNTLIYHAEKEEKPLIITTNDYDSLEHCFPEAILSRIYGSFVIIKANDKDYRVEKVP